MKVHYNNNNQLVANTKNGILRKRVQGSKHMRRKPPSWGFDVAIIKDTNAHEIRILDTEKDLVYFTSMDTFTKHGFTQDIGAGEQTFLTLEHWGTYKLGEKPQRQEHNFAGDVEWFDNEL